MHFTLMKKEAAEQQLLLDTSRSVSLPLVVFASLLRAREKYLFRGEGGGLFDKRLQYGLHEIEFDIL